MNDALWWIVPVALAAAVLAWWLAGRPGLRRARPPAAETTVAPSQTRALSTQQLDENDTRPFESTAISPEAAAEAEAAAQAAARETAEQARRLAEREARIAAERESAEAEAALHAAYLAAEQAAARRAAERQAVEAAARQRAAEEAAQAEAQARRRAAEQAARSAAEQQAAEAARLAAEQAALAQRQAAEREAAAHEAAARERAAAEAAALEAARAAAEATAEAAAAPPRRTPEQTLVLLADDSKVVRVKTSRLLAKHAFRVALAEDGEQALQMIESEVPAVLITDVEMPGIDGVELTRRVRANPRTAGVPIIMITSADDRLRSTADEAGVTVLLGKPYGDDDLVAHIARLAGVAVTAPAA
jgi:CheY-like chemotaxis protein